MPITNEQFEKIELSVKNIDINIKLHAKNPKSTTINSNGIAYLTNMHIIMVPANMNSNFKGFCVKNYKIYGESF